MVVLNIIIVIILVVLSGIFSGLNLGLMSLSPYYLKRMVKLGDKRAAKIYPLRKRGTLLLVTLLLGNVMVNAALSIFLGSLTAGIFAMLIATTLIVLFGEIFPQAFFSRYALILGAKTTWIVYIFLYLLYPISKPLSMVLDALLGVELPNMFSKKELHLILEEHTKSDKSDIDEDEMKILAGGLKFSERLVRDVMTPWKNVFYLSKNELLSREIMKEIHTMGHSRIPIFDNKKHKVIGVLHTKDLISLDPDDNEKVKKIMKKEVKTVFIDDHLDDILNSFKQARKHLFIVLNHLGKIEGLITLEDILEEIVGEIVDEYDLLVDMRKVK